MKQPREKSGNDRPKVSRGRNSQRQHVALGALERELDVARACDFARTENLDLPVMSAKDEFAAVESRIQRLESVDPRRYSGVITGVGEQHRADAWSSYEVEGSHASRQCNLTANPDESQPSDHSCVNCRVRQWLDSVDIPPG